MPGLDSPIQIIIVLLIALIILGPKRLPEVGRSLGRGIREFKDSVTGNDRPNESERQDPPSLQAPQQQAYTPPAYTPPPAEQANRRSE